MKISPETNDFSGFLQENVPFEVTVFNKSSRFQCSGFLLAAHSSKLKTLFLQNKEIYTENDNLESIVTLLHGGNVEVTDDNLLDFMKFGIHFDIPSLYQDSHSYIVKLLTEETFLDYFFICQKATTIAKEFDVGYNFYGHHNNLLYTLSKCRLESTLKKLFEHMPQAFQLVLSKEVLPITIDFLPEFLKEWNPETLLSFLQHLDSLDFNNMCQPKIMTLLKVTQTAVGEDATMQKLLVELQVKVVGSTMVNDVHLSLNPKDKILKEKVWQNMAHFYQVLALECYFPGAEFCNMIKIYNEWGKDKSTDDQVKITCRIPRTLLDVMEFQVNTNITECRAVTYDSPTTDLYVVSGCRLNDKKASIEAYRANKVSFDANGNFLNPYSYGTAQYILDKDLGLLTKEGTRYVNYIVIKCCLKVDESQPKSSNNRLLYDRRYDFQLLGFLSYSDLLGQIGLGSGKEFSTRNTCMIKIFPSGFAID